MDIEELQAKTKTRFYTSNKDLTDEELKLHLKKLQQQRMRRYYMNKKLQHIQEVEEETKEELIKQNEGLHNTNELLIKQNNELQLELNQLIKELKKIKPLQPIKSYVYL